MNAIDIYLAQLFSSLATHHPTVDVVFSVIANSSFLKGQILMLMFWWVWFYPRSAAAHFPTSAGRGAARVRAGSRNWKGSSRYSAAKVAAD